VDSLTFKEPDISLSYDIITIATSVGFIQKCIVSITKMKYDDH